MPELPEVEALAFFLQAKTAGRPVRRAELVSLSALKTYDPAWSALLGARVSSVERKGKYLCVNLDGIWLVVHLARAGWVHWRDRLAATAVKVSKGPLAARIGFEEGDGFDITEQGTEKRLAMWLVHTPEEVPGVARLGPDPLGEDFDAAALGRVLRGGGGQLKAALSDQSLIAGVGNAYSDEALHAARLSPFKPAAKLSDEEVARLHGALVGVLSAAVERCRGMDAGELKSDKKSSMAVHARTGLACPVCGDKVREVSYATRTFQYCPTCQTGGKVLADRRLSRLLK
ncbi:MAG: Fpg/Nei family DNA glycosylase [Acidimicrobiales bacterium]